MLAIAFLGFMVFAALAARVWHGFGPLRFDQRVRARVPSADADNRRWLTYLSFAGRPQAVIAESLVLAGLVAWTTRRLRPASFCAVVPIVVSVVAELVL